ncbi:MAG: CHAD domain-containing protein [Siculibacillus sp.]|nr:CHAD domain-containing protein [Siculibacillus sp.]
MNTPVEPPRPAAYDDTPLEAAPVAAGDGRFALLEGETLAQGLKRVLTGEIATAREALADPAIAPEEAVHRVRRRLKRARSIFFVVDEVSGANRENRTTQARDTARLLAGAREADVAAAEARRILARSEGSDVAAAGLLVERLENERAEAHRRLPPLAEVAARLRASEADARSLPDRFEAGRLLAEALVASYRRGRRDWRELGDGFSIETLHDWRKRVKQRRHLSALVPIETPVTSRAIQRDLGELGEILGEEHDLAMFQTRLETDERLLRPREGRDGIVELVARRRRKLAKKALELGEELYGSRTAAVGAALDELRELW